MAERSTGRALPLAVSVLALALCGAVPTEARALERPTFYLSLGDSLSRGWQPDPAGVGRVGNEGYTDVLLARERTRHPSLRAVKLGCPGETSTTMRTGGICLYRRGTQLRAAESFLRAHRGRVAFVTVSIGGNDVQRCSEVGTLAPACAQVGLTVLERAMPEIARRLRRAAGDTPVVGLTYYNAFLALYLQGDLGRAQALATVPMAAGLNARLRRAYRANRITVADVPRAFSSQELTRTESVPGFGPLPVAVARVCQWTWMCAPAPRGPDIHPNSVGYPVIATEVGRVLPQRAALVRRSRVSGSSPRRSIPTAMGWERSSGARPATSSSGRAPAPARSVQATR